MLQNVLAVEMKIDGKPTHVITAEQSKSADKIMSLLRDYQIIEPSELAEYLKSTIIGSNGSVSSVSGEAEGLSSKKIPKSIKKLKKVYGNK